MTYYLINWYIISLTRVYHSNHEQINLNQATQGKSKGRVVIIVQFVGIIPVDIMGQ